MDIEAHVVNLTKKRKLQWQLNSGIPLSFKQRAAKQDLISDLKKELRGLENKSMELRVTRINVKVHLI